MVAFHIFPEFSKFGRHLSPLQPLSQKSRKNALWFVFHLPDLPESTGTIGSPMPSVTARESYEDRAPVALRPRSARFHRLRAAMVEGVAASNGRWHGWLSQRCWTLHRQSATGNSPSQAIENELWYIIQIMNLDNPLVRKTLWTLKSSQGLGVWGYLSYFKGSIPLNL